MTYRQLRKKLQEMVDSDLDGQATVYNSDTSEYIPIKRFEELKPLNENDDDDDIFEDATHVMVI